MNNVNEIMVDDSKDQMVLLDDRRGVVEDVVCIYVNEEDDTSEKDVTEINDLNSDCRRDNDELVSF